MKENQNLEKITDSERNIIFVPDNSWSRDFDLEKSDKYLEKHKYNFTITSDPMQILIESSKPDNKILVLPSLIGGSVYASQMAAYVKEMRPDFFVIGKRVHNSAYVRDQDPQKSPWLKNLYGDFQGFEIKELIDLITLDDQLLKAIKHKDKNMLPISENMVWVYKNFPNDWKLGKIK